ncbi:MAG: diguanylate cyclase (GGDEF)-like protein [Psychromonas sp.]|jgi:diguanylate cyclase (GGDEF)-like protein|uniref:GGDEF domain-containing protein n=1 Tax=Psychromonas sp. TaxID=1884585 RepID=UPI0039E6F970
MVLLALKDKLTGLDNQNQFAISFQNSVNHNIEQRRNFSLLVLDLDKFKQINDQFGEQSANLVLTSFAKILSDCIRFRDQVFRYGDEQFTILLNDADEMSIPYIIDRIDKAVMDNSLLLEFNVSCRIGSADYKKNDDLSSLFERAEQDLDQAYEKMKMA